MCKGMRYFWKWRLEICVNFIHHFFFFLLLLFLSFLFSCSFFSPLFPFFFLFWLLPFFLFFLSLFFPFLSFFSSTFFLNFLHLSVNPGIGKKSISTNTIKLTPIQEIQCKYQPDISARPFIGLLYWYQLCCN